MKYELKFNGPSVLHAIFSTILMVYLTQHNWNVWTWDGHLMFSEEKYDMQECCSDN